MPYVVTQSCCADASCVLACPVNCIHPAPGEPGFATAEMLYVDADSCVDCGACATACPADAIIPHTRLTAAQQPFLALNADYYDTFPHPDRTPLAEVPRQRRLRRPGPFRVAVVGAGPAGLYTADELLKHPEIQVDVYDRLPTPYGLVRAGVAPDHQHTKQVVQLFRAIEEQPGFRYFLNVEVGRDVTHDELCAHYDGVVYAVGAATDRILGIPGEDLAGSVSATDFVGWYNGHPDKQHLDVPLDHERVVVVGNGNVALDVARMLTADPGSLEHTDVASLPWTALRRSHVREVVVLGRRGPGEASFTMPELIGLAGLDDIDVVVDTGDVPLVAGSDGTGTGTGTGTGKTRLLAEMAARPRVPGRRRIVLRFHTSPRRILGVDRVHGVEVVRDGGAETIETGLVLRAIGYRAHPVADLPWDELSARVPHQGGRVAPGVYVAGWVKRGPSGFIGTNKSCAEETVGCILDDLDTRAGPPVGTDHSIAAVVEGRRPERVDLAGWRAIDREERRRGQARGRARATIVEVDELVRVAHEPVTPAPRRRRYASARKALEKRS